VLSYLGPRREDETFCRGEKVRIEKKEENGEKRKKNNITSPVATPEKQREGLDQIRDIRSHRNHEGERNKEETPTTSTKKPTCLCIVKVTTIG